MSRYHDDYYPPSRPTYGERYGSGGPAALPYPPSEGRRSGAASPRAGSPGHTTWPAPESYRPAPSTSQALQVPASPSRPRSLPPPVQYRRTESSRQRSHYGDDRHSRSPSSYSSSSSSSRDRGATSPLEKTRTFFDDNFSRSTAGLGVGVLGAIVGGLAGHKATEATNRYRKEHQGHAHNRDIAGADEDRNEMIGAVFGAALGALGANAFEKHAEKTRREKERERRKEEEFYASPTQYYERRRRPSSGERRSGRIVETRHMVRTMSSEGRREFDPWDPRTRGQRGSGIQREVDPDARSWRDVEDWVYDDRKSGGAVSRSRNSSSGSHR